jgi:hypothetical protein
MFEALKKTSPNIERIIQYGKKKIKKKFPLKTKMRGS